MNCLRCNETMIFLGKRTFLEGTSQFFNSLDVPLAKLESIEIHACSQCGKVEFFLPNLKINDFDNRPAPIKLSLASPESLSIPNVSDLLKITPGECNLEEVCDSIGLPVEKHDLEEGIALCFPSEEEANPHVVLIDSATTTVQMVAIFNYLEMFTLKMLEETYGQRDLAGVIDGHEYWLFERDGTAFIVEGRNDSDILYIQFIKPTMSLAAYQEVSGYSKAVFRCSAV